MKLTTVHHAEPGPMAATACGRAVPEAARTMERAKITCEKCLKHLRTMGG